MAIKTQLRLNQLTASFGASAGQINDSLTNKAALADISVVDLSGSLSYLASSIRRIHGGADFSDQTAGEFSHAASTFTGKILVGGDTATGDDAALGYTAAEGIIITGQGSTNDVTVKNDADADVLVIPTGTTNVDIVGDASAANFKPDGDTSSGDAAAFGYTAALGAIITGQGSTNDVTLVNDADATVLSIPTGTTNVDVVGDLTAGVFMPDGDTSASDAAAIGYTAAEGIIITGQGSTNDVTIKNDLDTAVISIPTGGTAVEFAGDITADGGDIIVNAANDGNASLSLNADNSDDNGDDWVVSAVAANQSLSLLNNMSGGQVVQFSVTPHATATQSVTATAGNLKVGGNIIQASDGGSTMTLDTDDKVLFAGNLDHADSSWTIGSSITTPANKITLGGGAAVEILGDLFVKGTEHIIDTDNLRIKDPVIAMGAGNVTINSNGGIAIISGSSGPGASFAGGNADMVLGRVAVNTWGAGLLDTQSGSITSVTGMGLANMRVRNLELSGSANYLTFATDVKVVSAADIELTAGSLKPAANDGVALGEATISFSDLFLAEGGVINWDNGDLTLTQAGNVLTLAGGGLVSDVDVSSNTLTTSAAQNLAIMQGPGADVDIGAHDLRAATLTADGLTATRVVFAGANGVLSDDSDMVFVGDTLTVTKLGAYEQAGAVDFSDEAMTNVNIDSGAIDGTAIGANTASTGRFSKVEIDGATNYLDVDTDLKIVAAADIRLDAGGNDITMVSVGTNPFLDVNRAGAGEAYLNFSTNDGAPMTNGSGGFGFRNNSGTLQFKNSGGAWSSFGASSSASKKTTILTGSVAAGLRLGIDGGFDISGITGASQTNMVDVYVNGQMMLSGGTYASVTNDYAVDVLRGEALSDLRFNFALADADVVTVTVR